MEGFVFMVVGMAFISMGIGAVITIIAMVTGVEIRASHAFLAKWREQMGFTRVEFLERVVDEITGTAIEGRRELLKKYNAAAADFGAAAGCLTVLIFIPWHLSVTPIAYLELRRRKELLRRRIQRLSPSDRARIAPEYLNWLA